MKGRKPKPTKMKVIQGTFRKDRHTGAEADPNMSIPVRPEHLGADAVIEWDRISIELSRCGLLSEIDRSALAAYCQVYGRWVEAERIINEKGLLIKSPSGAIQQSPAVGAANRSLDLMHKYLTEFGMTPSSRTRIRVQPPGDDNKKKGFGGL